MVIVPPGIGIIGSLTTDLGSVWVNGSSFSAGGAGDWAAEGDMDPGTMSAKMRATPSTAPAACRLRHRVPFSILTCLLTWLFMASAAWTWGARAAHSGGLTRFTYTEYHMGVDARLVVYAPDQRTAEDACAAAFERIAALDTIMSDYRRDSELMRLCARAGGPPERVSPDLFIVLRRAQEVAQRSGGAFDVTVGPLVALWRQARKTRALPDPSALERARRLVGWQKLRLDEAART